MSESNAMSLNFDIFQIKESVQVILQNILIFSFNFSKNTGYRDLLFCYAQLLTPLLQRNYESLLDAMQIAVSFLREDILSSVIPLLSVHVSIFHQWNDCKVMC